MKEEPVAYSKDPVKSIPKKNGAAEGALVVMTFFTDQSLSLLKGSKLLAARFR